uniref:Iodothyronine deiodinase n=1 Tax=Branchiostoma floridae TaxID=7739 RepID=C3YLU9_BRAFL|eukprot:XP_002602531.1 hypothetical protein BRAFLDRAFT_93836 [Branchiostoma floridae]
MKALQGISLALRFVGFVVVFVTTRAVRTVLGVLSPSLQRKMDIHIAKRSQMCDSSLAMEDYSDLADSNVSGPLLVDTMDDVANRKYGAWPERLYILLDGRVMYKGMPGPQGYHVHQVRDWLEKYLRNN